MKTKVDIRVFAIQQAVVILGAGAPSKDVVSKALEIEKYITEGIELPDVDTSSPLDIVNGIMPALTAATAVK